MSNNSVIEHRACYHFIKVEEDYIAISSNGKRSPHCKALILAILEGWTNEKGRDVYIYMSLPQWTKATYMLYERNVITDCLQELLEEQLIDRRSIIMNDQKTFEYKLNVAKVQALIKDLPEKESKNLPNLDNYLAFKERNKAERKKGVVEKSHTPKKASEKSHRVVEKSHTPIEKSTTVCEKSTEGYVKNQRNLDSNLDSHLDNNLDCSNVESASADIDATHNPLSPPSKKRGGRKHSEENNTSNETEQPTLIEMPAAPPTIPAEDAKWCAETLVQIVEAKRNKRFEEITRTVKGKVYKTQRQRQLEAADVIIKAKFTREQFEQGYDHRLDDWWIQERGDLTVVDMINNTTKGTMRLIEELEKIASQAKRMQNRPTSQGQTIKHGQRPEDYENSEVSRNNTSHLEQVLAKHKAMLATQGKGA